jgi:hypothetical protein
MYFFENKGQTNAMHLTDNSFQVQKGYSDNNNSQEVRNKEDAAPILVYQVGKPPKRAESNSVADE